MAQLFQKSGCNAAGWSMKLQWTASRIWLFTLIALTPLALRFVMGDYGYATPESCCFIMHYNSGKPLLELIFDPNRTDWNLYQARELSYFIDALDAKFIAWCIEKKIAHFLSLSSILFFILTIFVQQYGIAKCFPRQKWFTSLLPSLLFGFAYVSANFNFFRSSKPAVAFFLTLLFFGVTWLLKNPEKTGRGKRIAEISTAVSLIMMPLFDRQGFFFAGVFTVGTLLIWIASVSKKTEKFMDLSREQIDSLRLFSWCGFASLLISTLWNLLICPEIIMAVNGYYPSFEYQQLPMGAYFNFAGGISFFFRNVGFLFFPFASGISGIVGGIMITLLLGISFFIEYKTDKKFRLTALWGAVLFSGIILGNTMTARHNAILRDDVIFGAYFLPFLAIFTVFFASILANVPKKTSCLLAGLAIIAVVGGISLKCKLIEAPGSENDMMFLYKAVGPQVISTLNTPGKAKEMPLPFTNSLLIDFFRSREK